MVPNSIENYRPKRLYGGIFGADTVEKLGFEAATKFAGISFEGRKSNQRPSSWLSEPSERDFACRSASLRVDVTRVALKRKKYSADGRKRSFSTLSCPLRS
jgi:hypothetical protein